MQINELVSKVEAQLVAERERRESERLKQERLKQERRDARIATARAELSFVDESWQVGQHEKHLRLWSGFALEGKEYRLSVDVDESRSGPQLYRLEVYRKNRNSDNQWVELSSSPWESAESFDADAIVKFIASALTA